MDPRELLEENLTLVDRVVGRVCAKGGLSGADAEDFGSEVRIALIADDYAILRQWEGRAALGTYLTVIVQRLLADARIRERGRWHASAEAQRIGAAAVTLERIVLREGRTVDDALPHLRAIDPALTRRDAVAMLARLPDRAPRPRAVEIDETIDLPSVRDAADARTTAAEAERLSAKTSGVVRQAIAALPLQDRMILRFRFGSGMSIADVARMLRIPQRPVYRRIEAILRTLRDALGGAGIAAGAVEELIGSQFELDFGLAERKNGAARQTIESETAEGQTQ